MNNIIEIQKRYISTSPSGVMMFLITISRNYVVSRSSLLFAHLPLCRLLLQFLHLIDCSSKNKPKPAARTLTGKEESSLDPHLF